MNCPICKEDMYEDIYRTKCYGTNSNQKHQFEIHGFRRTLCIANFNVEVYIGENRSIIYKHESERHALLFCNTLSTTHLDFEIELENLNADKIKNILMLT